MLAKKAVPEGAALAFGTALAWKAEHYIVPGSLGQPVCGGICAPTDTPYVLALRLAHWQGLATGCRIITGVLSYKHRVESG